MLETIPTLVARQARAWEQQDIAAIIADFSLTCLFIAPGVIIQGRDDLATAARNHFAIERDIQIQIHRIITAADGTHGAVEWTWTATEIATGQRISMEDAIIVEQQDGKIVYWREYFDTAPLKEG